MQIFTINCNSLVAVHFKMVYGHLSSWKKVGCLAVAFLFWILEWKFGVLALYSLLDSKKPFSGVVFCAQLDKLRFGCILVWNKSSLESGCTHGVLCQFKVIYIWNPSGKFRENCMAEISIRSFDFGLSFSRQHCHPCCICCSLTVRLHHGHMFKKCQPLLLHCAFFK